ncbi:MAG TPA: YafY family protein, partial [Rhodothermales bacterium]
MAREKSQNRTERLFNIILLLQNRPNLSSRDLAEHFGVSRRTIFRDLRALSESGVPLTYAGEGGYEILEGYQLHPLMLNAREAAVLLVGTEFMMAQSDETLRRDAEQVALKMRAELPEEIREYVDRLRERTVLDPYWVNAVRAERREEGHWHKIAEAVARQQTVAMQYMVQSRGELTQRRIDPLGLVYYTDHWNVIAYDHLRKDIRSFKLDQIQRLQVSSNRFEWPKGFDLQAYLQERGEAPDATPIRLAIPADRFEQVRTRIPATVQEVIARDDEVEVH